mmetsp:Transcript_153472/g.272142  ORF Transcript_153472/g.272142 Transcript_153472/m.272142 type:complete len:211 (+) Transcript_153472:600-1232(+)
MHKPQRSLQLQVHRHQQANQSNIRSKLLITRTPALHQLHQTQSRFTPVVSTPRNVLDLLAAPTHLCAVGKQRMQEKQRRNRHATCRFKTVTQTMRTRSFAKELASSISVSYLPPMMRTRLLATELIQTRGPHRLPPRHLHPRHLQLRHLQLRLLHPPDHRLRRELRKRHDLRGCWRRQQQSFQRKLSSSKKLGSSCLRSQRRQRSSGPLS